MHRDVTSVPFYRGLDIKKAESYYYSAYAQFDIVSDTCNPCLNSEKFFPVSDDYYCNAERGFEPETLVSVST